MKRRIAINRRETVNNKNEAIKWDRQSKSLSKIKSLLQNRNKYEINS